MDGRFPDYYSTYLYSTHDGFNRRQNPSYQINIMHPCLYLRAPQCERHESIKTLPLHTFTKA